MFEADMSWAEVVVNFHDRLARLAYASSQDGDESTDIDSEISETTQDP
jgi:hypothetical protein